MLREVMDVFQEMLDQFGDRLILDEYVPKNGTYRLVVVTEDSYRVEHTFDIRYDKKKDSIYGKEDGHYEMICFMDYWSKLVTMNKSVDAKKIVHSNNYLALAVKKESIKENKVTSEILDGYYDILLHPESKYTKSKARKLYRKVEEELGAVDEKLLARICEIALEGTIWEDIDLSEKDYCKVFFILEDKEKTRKLYETEGKRYLLPNIYNSNDFNEDDAGEVVGMPSNNISMNSKKPFLANRTRKISTPYLLNQSDVLLQTKLFDYLSGLAAKNLMNIYVSSDWEGRKIRGYRDNEAAPTLTGGYYLRLQKGKTELEIRQWYPIHGMVSELSMPFVYRNILDVKESEKFKNPYGTVCDRLYKIQEQIDAVLFDGALVRNYFTEAKDIRIVDAAVKRNLIVCREKLFAWFRIGRNEEIPELMDKTCGELALHAICGDNIYRARKILNLQWSLKDYFDRSREGERNMRRIREQLREHMNGEEEWEFSEEKEFCYAVGQMAAYLISLSKANTIRSSLINPLLNAKNHADLKENLLHLYKKYDYAIVHANRSRVYKLITRIMEYEGNEQIAEDYLLAGYTAEIMIYEKKEEEKADE